MLWCHIVNNVFISHDDPLRHRCTLQRTFFPISALILLCRELLNLRVFFLKSSFELAFELWVQRQHLPCFHLSLPLISFSLCSLICCVHCFQSILFKRSSCHRRLCHPCLIKVYLLSITYILGTLIFSKTILIYGYLSFISLVIIYFSYNKWLLGTDSYIG